MDDGLLTFKKFRDEDVAKDIAQKLNDSGVYYTLENDDKFFDPTFAHNPMQKEIRIKIKPFDFVKARKALEDYYDTQIVDINTDHYLFDFTDRELFEILEKPDEWGELDYRLAQKILTDREYDISEENINSLKKKRIEVLAKPEKSAAKLIIIGYLSAFLGGMFGVITGLILNRSTKTLPNGIVVHTYSDKDRWHGKTMFTIGIVVFVLAIFLVILSKLNQVL